MRELILVGASVRSAAWSALRAGFEPWCVDLFGDEDLARIAPTKVLSPDEYPQGLRMALAGAPQAPWIYTGALENRLGLIEALARLRPLWGNGPEVLRRIRSPFELAEACERTGLPYPRVLPAAPADGGRWLIKPRASAGAHIRPWSEAHEVTRGQYCQEWIDGVSCSALYLGQPEGTAMLLGVTRQLVGESWLHAGPFRYCGSIGPLVLTDVERAGFLRLGGLLTTELGVRGLFGVDCVLRDELPFPVEVNPRYTASTEIIEHILRLPLLALHGIVFDRGVKLPDIPSPRPSCCFGKAILYAERPLVFPPDGPWKDLLDRESAWTLPEFADVPRAGQHIAPGQPILSVLAQDKDNDQVEARLRELVRKVEEGWTR